VCVCAYVFDRHMCVNVCVSVRVCVSVSACARARVCSLMFNTCKSVYNTLAYCVNMCVCVCVCEKVCGQNDKEQRGQVRDN